MAIETKPTDHDLPPLSPLGILSDFSLWILIILLIGGVSYYLRQHVLHGSKRQEFTLQLRDGDAIKRGSSVRLMGLDVGQVTDVSLLDDQIRLEIVTQANAPVIPPNARASVVSHGLAGQRSLEFDVPQGTPFPPSKLSMSTPFKVQPTIRLKQATQFQIDIAQSLQQASESADEFFKRYPIEKLKSDIHWTSAESAQMILDFEDFLSKLQKVDDRFSRYSNQILKSFYQIDKVSVDSLPYFDSQNGGLLNKANIARFKDWSAEEKSSLNTQVSQLEPAFYQKVNAFNKNAQSLNKVLPSWLDEKEKDMQGLKQSLDALSQDLQVLNQSDQISPESLKRLNSKIKATNQRLEQLNQSL